METNERRRSATQLATQAGVRPDTSAGVRTDANRWRNLLTCVTWGAGMPGEEEQRTGREGALLAKRWLDRSTRVSASLVNPDGVAKTKLRLKKAVYHDLQDVFSFDLGGRFRDGEFNGQEFLAECKAYKKSADLGTHYRDFLARCYRAIILEHQMADQFFWIAFSPHGVTKWDKLASVDEVRNSVLHPACRDINFLPSEDPAAEFSDEAAKQVSERLWLLVLSEKQIEHLTLTKEHHAVIESHIVNNATELSL